MEIKEAEYFIIKLEELLKEEEKLTKMYFDLTILASNVGAENTYQDMNNIGEIVGEHQNKTKQLIGNFKAARTRIIKTMEVQGKQAKPSVRTVPLSIRTHGFRKRLGDQGIEVLEGMALRGFAGR